MIHSNLGVQRKEEGREKWRQSQVGGPNYIFYWTTTYQTKDCTDMRKWVAKITGPDELEWMVAEQSKLTRCWEVWNDNRRIRSPMQKWWAGNCWYHRSRTPLRDYRSRTPLRGNKHGVPIGEIRIIARGFSNGGTSSSGRKVYAQKSKYEEVYLTDRASKCQRSDGDLEVSYIPMMMR